MSVNIIVSESHLSLHSWPEHNYAAIDIYSCSSLENTLKAANYIINKLKPEKHCSLIIYRGDVISKKIRIRKKDKV